MKSIRQLIKRLQRTYSRNVPQDELTTYNIISDQFIAFMRGITYTTPRPEFYSTHGTIDDHVPDDLRYMSMWFCDTYDIDGSADPMYICNISALELGVGDGQGSFMKPTH